MLCSHFAPIGEFSAGTRDDRGAAMPRRSVKIARAQALNDKCNLGVCVWCVGRLGASIFYLIHWDSAELVRIPFQLTVRS